MSLPEGITKVVSYIEPKDRAVGLTRFGKKEIPTDTVFVFPNCEYPTNFTTKDMHERIRGYAIHGADKNFAVITRYEMDPGSLIGVDERVKHFVETSAKAPIIKNFEFLKDFIK